MRDPLAGFGVASRQGEGLGWERGGKGEVEGREREGPQVTVEPGPLRALLRHWVNQVDSISAAVMGEIKSRFDSIAI